MSEVQEEYLEQNRFEESNIYGGEVTSVIKKHEKLDREEINALQRDIDIKCIEYINNCAEKHLINEEEAEYLKKYYSDAMAVYADFYYSLEEVFGEPISIYEKSPKTGRTFKSNPLEKKDITPNNYIVLEYLDSYGNPMYLTMPGMKNVERAIEKLHPTKGRYAREYKEKMDALDKKYPIRSMDYWEELAEVEKPVDRIRDILRCTFSTRYLDELENVEKKFEKSSNNFKIVSRENKFLTNDQTSKHALLKRKNNYRDKTLTLEMGNGFHIEVQMKVQELEKADLKTHSIYQKLRVNKDNLEQETDEVKKLQLEYDIRVQEMDIRNITAEALDKYNLKVMNTAKGMEKRIRIEENKRRSSPLIRQLHREKNGKKQQEIRKKLRSMQKNSFKSEFIHSETKDFIEGNLIYRPFKAFNEELSLETEDKELKSFIELNYPIVTKKYNGSIEKNVPEWYWKDYDEAVKEAEKPFERSDNEPLLPLITTKKRGR